MFLLRAEMAVTSEVAKAAAEVTTPSEGANDKAQKRKHDRHNKRNKHDKHDKHNKHHKRGQWPVNEQWATMCGDWEGMDQSLTQIVARTGDRTGGQAAAI